MSFADSSLMRELVKECQVNKVALISPAVGELVKMGCFE